MILSFYGSVVLINGAMGTGGRGLRCVEGILAREEDNVEAARGSWIDSCHKILLSFVIEPCRFNF